MAEARLAYGPNSPMIRRFLQRLAALNAIDEEGVVAEYERRVATSDFSIADSAIATLVARSGRESERDATAGPLLQLVAERGDRASPANDGNASVRPIAEPALAALLGLLMFDLLQPAHFNVLYQSFQNAIPFESLK